MKTHIHIHRPVIMFRENIHNRTRWQDFYDPVISPPELFWRPGDARQAEIYDDYMEQREAHPNQATRLALKWGMVCLFVCLFMVFISSSFTYYVLCL